jgi:hypothetical protein
MCCYAHQAPAIQVATRQPAENGPMRDLGRFGGGLIGVSVHTSRPIDLESAARCCAVLDNQVSIVASAPSDYLISSGLLAAWEQNSQGSQAHEGASEMA